MTAPDLDGLAGLAAREAAGNAHGGRVGAISTQDAQGHAEGSTGAQGGARGLDDTCVRREHQHEPYATITRLQLEVDRQRQEVSKWRRLALQVISDQLREAMDTGSES